jgi:hypothetical protein
LFVARHSIGQTEKGTAVTLDEYAKRVPIARQGLRHVSSIASIHPTH